VYGRQRKGRFFLEVNLVIGKQSLISGVMVLGFLTAVGLGGTALAMGERGEHGGRMHPKVLERLANHLELTDQQKTQVEAILKSKMAQVRKIHEQVRPQIEAIRKSTDQDIRSLLTPAQQVKYKQLLDEKAKRMKERGGGPK
jgi:Spy/CpxP family protein refolding chaperone